MRAVLALCRERPAAHHTLWIRGWFTAVAAYANGPTGLLFQSSNAVPLTAIDNPDFDGHWKGISPLHPGQTIVQHQFVIMGGVRIRVSLPFTPTWNPRVSQARNTLVTHPLTMRLTPEQAPWIVLHRAAGALFAVVTGPPHVAGSKQLLSYSDCGFPAFGYTFGWVASGPEPEPDCSPVQQWHVRVAWLGHPVAGFDYVATPPPTPAPTATATPLPTGPAFSEILRRADRAMSSIHALHADGLRTVAGVSGRLNLHIRGDCHSRTQAGNPIMLRTVVSGRRTQSGRNSPRYDAYVIQGPTTSTTHGPTRSWERSGALNRWHPVHLRQRWHTSQGISDPVLGPNSAYTNQICPDLLRPTYLATPLPSFTARVLGLETLAGHKAWHLREHQWFRLDLYIDASNYRVLRLRLWNGSKPTDSWQIRFDYSRFNSAATFTIPTGRKAP